MFDQQVGFMAGIDQKPDLLCRDTVTTLLCRDTVTTHLVTSIVGYRFVHDVASFCSLQVEWHVCA